MRYLFMEALVAALLLTGSVSYGSDAGHIGIIKSFSGDVIIVRSDVIINAQPNLKLMEGDVVQTGANGKSGLILEDDTVISMGPNSRIVIKNFIFLPIERKLSLIAKVIRGTVSFLSGQIAKLAPHQVHIETPYATIGIRGTHVLVQVE